MTTEMYYVDGAERSKEELAEQVKDGEDEAAALPLSQNEGFFPLRPPSCASSILSRILRTI